MPFLLLFPLFFVTVTTYHFSATTLWTILWVPVVTSTEYYNKHFKSSRQKSNNKSNRNLLDIGLSNIVSPINPWEYGNRLNMFLSLQHPTFFAWSWHLHLGGLTVAKILSSHPLSSCFLIWFDSHWVFGNLVGKLISPHGAWLWRAVPCCVSSAAGTATKSTMLIGTDRWTGIRGPVAGSYRLSTFRFPKAWPSPFARHWGMLSISLAWPGWGCMSVVYVCTIFFTFNVIPIYLPLLASFLPTHRRHRTQCLNIQCIYIPLSSSFTACSTSTSNPHASLAYIARLDSLPFQDGLQEAAGPTPLWKMFKSGRSSLPRWVDTEWTALLSEYPLCRAFVPRWLS